MSMTKSLESNRNLAKGLCFVLPWIIGFFLFTAVPMALSFYYSFCDYSLLQRPAFIGWRNYYELWFDPIFWVVLRNTGIYAAIALPAGVVFALTLALLLNARIRGQAIYRTIIFLPSLVPSVASAMLWLWLLNARLGLVNTVLRAAGAHDPPAWLGDRRWAMISLIVMSLWGLGNTVVIYLAGLQDVPRELYEAAELDGAGALRRVWHVTLPCISPVIFFNIVMAIIATAQIFGTPYIMTGGGPARSTYFYTMYLYDNAFTYLKMGYASAMSWIQFFIVLAITAVAAMASKRWVHYSSK